MWSSTVFGMTLCADMDKSSLLKPSETAVPSCFTAFYVLQYELTVTKTALIGGEYVIAPIALQELDDHECNLRRCCFA